jgi:hypothetical protein
MEGGTIDVRVVTDGKAAAASGVAHAEELVALAEAAVGNDESALKSARARLRSALGDEALVDAAAVVANFQRMVRIADATGIPVDPPLGMVAADVQRELALDRFASSANTPEPGVFERALGRILRPVLIPAMRLRAKHGAPRRRS